MNTLIVGIGGILGALARYGLSLAFNPSSSSQFPWGTLLCNFAGCLLLGWIASLAENLIPPRLKLGLTTGFIGAFTTFSTFSIETVKLLKTGMPVLAAVYVLTSLLGGLALTWLGTKLAEMAANPRSPRGESR